MIVLDPAFDHFSLLGAEADVSGLALRTANGQYQHGMAVAPVTLRAAGLVANGSVEQGPAQEFGGGQVASELIAAPDDVLVFHFYQ